jgi:hypothetical protein
MDAVRQAFFDRSLEVSLHAAGKADAGVALARITPDKLPDPDAKARKAAAAKRKVAFAAAAAARATPAAKNADTTRPPPKRLWSCPLADSRSPSSPFMRHYGRRK